MVKRGLPDDDDYSDQNACGMAPKLRNNKRPKPKTHTVPNPRKNNQISTGTIDDTAGAAHPSIAPQHPKSLHEIENPTAIRVALLEWFETARDSRGMPWRKVYDPSLNSEQRAQRAYEVWISEIMLQQTQVATVIPYYNRWMEKFPSIKDLASSDIETVNSLWKGLGYYSRAARLLEGARKTVKELNDRLPTDAKSMESKIPGIGRYSAGAICSIAYNESVPAVDGNVHRLMSRILALHAPPKNRGTTDLLWAGASKLLEGCDRPGDLNQALIELGSTVCKVRTPECEACPISFRCNAYQATKKVEKVAIPDIEELCSLCEPLPCASPVTAYPMKTERKKPREELDLVSVIEWRSENCDRWFLLVRRPEGGLLAGLDEFPTTPNVTASSGKDFTRSTHELLKTLLTCPVEPLLKESSGNETLRVTKQKSAGDILHVFSHIKKTYRTQWVVLKGGGEEPPKLKTFTAVAPSKRNLKTSSKANAKKRKDIAGSDSDNMETDTRIAIGQAVWRPLSEVADANIGTGVVKVWNQVRSLWEK